MTFDALTRQLRAARRQRTLFAIVAVFLLISNVLLAGAYSRSTTTTVLIPSRVSDGMVAAGAVDMRFVEALAMDAIYAFYNASPETTDYGRKIVERLASLRDRQGLLEAFDQVSEDIRKRRISTTFFISRVDHHPDTLQVKVTGYLSTFIEKQKIASEERTVTLQFVEEASSVRLARMTAEETPA